MYIRTSAGESALAVNLSLATQHRAHSLSTHSSSHLVCAAYPRSSKVLQPPLSTPASSCNPQNLQFVQSVELSHTLLHITSLHIVTFLPARPRLCIPTRSCVPDTLPPLRSDSIDDRLLLAYHQHHNTIFDRGRYLDMLPLAQ